MFDHDFRKMWMDWQNFEKENNNSTINSLENSLYVANQ